MASEVLKELLVAVLTRFDEASERQTLAAVDKSQDKISDREKKGTDTRNKNLAGSLADGLKHLQGYTKNVVQLGERVALSLAGIAGSIEGAAVSGTIALAKLSKEMSAAYYSGQKLGSAVKDMDAFRFASEQAGSSAAKAQAGLEELGRLRNTNPAAYVGLLQRLGVAATDAAGKLRAPAEAAMDLAPALAKMPRQMQLLFGNQLGMDDDQTLAMVRPQFLAQIAQYREMQKKIGFDPDKAAADGAKFEQIWNTMWAAVDLVSKKVEAAFFNEVGGSIGKVTDWLVKNSGRISDLAIKVGNYVLHLATSIFDLVGNFDKLDPATQRFVEILGGVAVALLTLNAGPIGAILALSGALIALWDDYEKYKQGLPHVVDWDTWEPKITATIKGLTDLWAKFDELSQKITGQGGVQTAMEGFAVFMAGRWAGMLLGAFTRVEGGWLGMVARLMANPYFAAIAALMGGAAISLDSAKNIQSADPAANDLYVDPESGVATKVAPGAGNQATGGLGDTNNSVLGRAWNWAKGKLGFGKEDQAATGGRTVVDQSISPEGRALLDTLASGEAKDYNVANGGGTFSSYADHPFAGGHRAAGRYQFLPSTWKGIQKETGLGDFSPKNQDQGAWYLAKRDYKLHTGRDLETDLKSKDPARIAGIGQALHPTWVSLNGSFSGKYQRFLGRDSVPVAAPAALSAQAPLGQVGDTAYFAAEQRRQAGSPLTGDAALLAAYRQQQASSVAPKAGYKRYLAWASRGAKVSDPDDASITTVDRRDPRFAPKSDTPIKVEVTKAPLDPARQILADAMRKGVVTKLPALSHALGVTPSLYQAYDHSRSMTNSATIHQAINIHGVQDPHSIGDHLKIHAKRGVQDSIRSIQGPSG